MYFYDYIWRPASRQEKTLKVIILLRIFILIQIFTLSICTHLDALQRLSLMGFF